MSRNLGPDKITAHDIEELLRSGDVPEPPRELAERIKADIPSHLKPADLDRAPEGSEAGSRGPGGPRRWLIAAALVSAVGAGLLTYQLAQRELPSQIAEPTAPSIGLDDRAAGLDTGNESRDAARAGGPEDEAAAGVERPESPALLEQTESLAEPPAEPPSSPDSRSSATTRGDSEVSQPPDRLGRIQTPAAAAPAAAAPAPPPPPPAEPKAEVRREMDRGLRVTDDLRASEPPARQVPRPSGELRKRVEEQVVIPDPTPDDAAALAGEPLQVLDYLDADISISIPEGEPAMESLPVQTVPAPSTGGTEEPNDMPYGDVFYKEYGVNPFIDPEDDPLSTFGLDVDTGSFTVARRYLDDGHLPPREAVRVEELVNYPDYGDAPPAAGEGDFAIHADIAPTPFGEGERYALLRFGIKGREVSRADRKPALLIFVVDVSGSMSQENRLGLVRRSLGLLLDELGPQDRVGLVVYGSRGEVLLEPTGDLEAIRGAVDRLVPEGSTNAEEGLQLAYELARKHLRPGAINRLILCSDGVANVGRTGPDSILEMIGEQARRGIELTTVGFGMGNYNDVLMEQLADRGDGRYAYVDRLDEARRLFVEELTGTLQTIASEARVQVEVDPAAVSSYRLLGYENRAIADDRFRDDTVDAGEIGAGHSVTALYEVKLRPELPLGAEIATLRLRYRSTESGEWVEVERRVRRGELAASWQGAPAVLRLAGLTAELAELLKGSYWALEGSFDRVLRGLQELAPELAGNAEVAEITAMAARASKVSGPPEQR